MGFIKTQDSLKNEVELVGSWTVNVGDQDQALHLWKFTGGFEKIDDYNKIFRKSEVRRFFFLISNQNSHGSSFNSFDPQLFFGDVF